MYVKYHSHYYYVFAGTLYYVNLDLYIKMLLNTYFIKYNNLLIFSVNVYPTDRSFRFLYEFLVQIILLKQRLLSKV